LLDFLQIYYINPIPKAVTAMVSTVFDCGGNCAVYANATGPDGSALRPNTTSFEYALHYIDETASYWNWIGWLILTVFVLRVFFFWAVAKVNWNRR